MTKDNSSTSKRIVLLLLAVSVIMITLGVVQEVKKGDGQSQAPPAAQRDIQISSTQGQTQNNASNTINTKPEYQIAIERKEIPAESIEAVSQINKSDVQPSVKNGESNEQPRSAKQQKLTQEEIDEYERNN